MTENRRIVSKEELAAILAQHKEYRESGGSRGARADLAGADLAGADLARADLAGANLAGAYLARANLAGADLAGADLAGAYLARAYLAGADLAGADLAGADLARANLARANLAGANLAGANLADADLADADLAGANLADADLADADLAGAYLAGAKSAPAGHVDPATPYVRKPGAGRAEHMRRYRERHPDVPVVENPDAKTLAAIESGAGTLDMSRWHSCETTHCIAGWAIHHAGKAGYELEAKLGSAELAGRQIYLASTGRAPYFFASNQAALDGLRRRAAEQAAEAATA